MYTSILMNVWQNAMRIVATPDLSWRSVESRDCFVVEVIALGDVNGLAKYSFQELMVQIMYCWACETAPWSWCVGAS